MYEQSLYKILDDVIPKKVLKSNNIKKVLGIWIQLRI